MSNRLRAAAGCAAAALLLAIAGTASASAATPPALFKVGTAVVDISPDKPMAVGGYGANYIVNERRARPASGARVLRRPRQAGRDVRLASTRRAGSPPTRRRTPVTAPPTRATRPPPLWPRAATT